MGYERNWHDDRYDQRDYDRYRRAYDPEERGFLERAGDEVRSWFGDEEAARRRRMDDTEWRRRHGSDRGYSDYDRGVSGSYGAAGGYSESSGRSYAAFSHDPGYHQWRNRQIAALARDHDEYRRSAMSGSSGTSDDESVSFSSRNRTSARF